MLDRHWKKNGLSLNTRRSALHGQEGVPGLEDTPQTHSASFPAIPLFAIIGCLAASPAVPLSQILLRVTWHSPKNVVITELKGPLPVYGNAI